MIVLWNKELFVDSYVLENIFSFFIRIILNFLHFLKK